MSDDFDEFLASVGGSVDKSGTVNNPPVAPSSSTFSIDDDLADFLGDVGITTSTTQTTSVSKPDDSNNIETTKKSDLDFMSWLTDDTGTNETSTSSNTTTENPVDKTIHSNTDFSNSSTSKPVSSTALDTLTMESFLDEMFGSTNDNTTIIPSVTTTTVESTTTKANQGNIHESNTTNYPLDVHIDPLLSVEDIQKSLLSHLDSLLSLESDINISDIRSCLIQDLGYIPSQYRPKIWNLMIKNRHEEDTEVSLMNVTLTDTPYKSQIILDMDDFLTKNKEYVSILSEENITCMKEICIDIITLYCTRKQIQYTRNLMTHLFPLVMMSYQNEVPISSISSCYTTLLTSYIPLFTAPKQMLLGSQYIIHTWFRLLVNYHSPKIGQYLDRVLPGWEMPILESTTSLNNDKNSHRQPSPNKDTVGDSLRNIGDYPSMKSQSRIPLSSMGSTRSNLSAEDNTPPLLYYDGCLPMCILQGEYIESVPLPYVCALYDWSILMKEKYAGIYYMASLLEIVSTKLITLSASEIRHWFISIQQGDPYWYKTMLNSSSTTTATVDVDVSFSNVNNHTTTTATTTGDKSSNNNSSDSSSNFTDLGWDSFINGWIHATAALYNSTPESFKYAVQDTESWIQLNPLKIPDLIDKLYKNKDKNTEKSNSNTGSFIIDPEDLYHSSDDHEENAQNDAQNTNVSINTTSEIQVNSSVPPSSPSRVHMRIQNPDDLPLSTVNPDHHYYEEEDEDDITPLPHVPENTPAVKPTSSTDNTDNIPFIDDFLFGPSRASFSIGSGGTTSTTANSSPTKRSSISATTTNATAPTSSSSNSTTNTGTFGSLSKFKFESLRRISISNTFTSMTNSMSINNEIEAVDIEESKWPHDTKCNDTTMCIWSGPAEVLPCLCSQRRRPIDIIDQLSYYFEQGIQASKYSKLTTNSSSSSSINNPPASSVFHIESCDTNDSAVTQSGIRYSIRARRGCDGIAFPLLPSTSTIVTTTSTAIPGSINTAEENENKPYYYGIDCRSEQERALGQFPKAYILDATFSSDSDEISMLLETLTPLASSVHLCIIGSGHDYIRYQLRQQQLQGSHKINLSQQDSIQQAIQAHDLLLNNVAFFFQKKNFKHVSILDGGFMEAMNYIQRSILLSAPSPSHPNSSSSSSSSSNNNSGSSGYHNSTSLSMTSMVIDPDIDLINQILGYRNVSSTNTTLGIQSSISGVSNTLSSIPMTFKTISTPKVFSSTTFSTLFNAKRETKDDTVSTTTTTSEQTAVTTSAAPTTTATTTTVPTKRLNTLFSGIGSTFSTFGTTINSSIQKNTSNKAMNTSSYSTGRDSFIVDSSSSSVSAFVIDDDDHDHIHEPSTTATAEDGERETESSTKKTESHDLVHDYSIQDTTKISIVTTDQQRAQALAMHKLAGLKQNDVIMLTKDNLPGAVLFPALACTEVSADSIDDNVNIEKNKDVSDISHEQSSSPKVVTSQSHIVERRNSTMYITEHRYLAITRERFLVLNSNSQGIGSHATVESNHHLTELQKMTFRKKDPEMITLFFVTPPDEDDMVNRDNIEGNVTSVEENSDNIKKQKSRVFRLTKRQEFIVTLQV